MLRTGATMDTTQGSKTIADLDLPGSNLAGHQWETPVMDGTGRLVVQVIFTDGSSSQVLVP